MAVDMARNILDLLALSPEYIYSSLIFLGAIVLLNDLVRTALMVECTRSVINHVVIDVLTLLPAILIGLALMLGGYRHPERVWINFVFAAILYLAWYAGGKLTVLSRRDTEGADIGWMAMGTLITVPCGLLAVLLFRVF